MKQKLNQAVTGGIVATAVMTMVMFIAPYMGLPKMNPAAMLSGMLGLHIVIGWIMHFMIGVLFALTYAFFFQKAVRKVQNNYLKGGIFGFAVFLFAQIVMAIMNAVLKPASAPEGSMTLMIVGSIIGHIIYGIVVSLFVKEQIQVEKNTYAR
jgi:uncharacterized membrane protein YkvI